MMEQLSLFGLSKTVEKRERKKDDPAFETYRMLDLETVKFGDYLRTVDDIYSYVDNRRQFVIACSIFDHRNHWIPQDQIVQHCSDLFEMLHPDDLLMVKDPRGILVQGQFKSYVYDKKQKRKMILIKRKNDSLELFDADQFVSVIKMAKEKKLICLID